MPVPDNPPFSQSLPDAQLPSPPSERGAWLLACAVGGLGLAVFVAVFTGLVGRSAPASEQATPPPVILKAATPAPRTAVGSTAGVSSSGAGSSANTSSSAAASWSARPAIVSEPSGEEQSLDESRFVDQTETQISPQWMEGFYPIYAVAQATFGVNWLLIASIHKQESAFSTAPSTYHGLNFAGCCGGPMQFNVKNGPVTTWDLVSDSYIYGRRPSHYNHETATHPSIYDDFDSIMAAAHLLSADGAGWALDGSAWDAAYDYYGHDATGVTYADQVLARAIGWSQHSFCINCGVEASLVQAVHAAYGAPVLAALITAERQAAAAAAAAAATKAKAEAKHRPRKR